MINRAFRIVMLPPSSLFGARLAFANPMGRTRIIDRDITITAESQARRLAAATPGFIAFGALNGKEWVYITHDMSHKGVNRNAC